MFIPLLSLFLAGKRFQSGKTYTRQMFRVVGEVLECILSEGIGGFLKPYHVSRIAKWWLSGCRPAIRLDDRGAI